MRKKPLARKRVSGFFFEKSPMPVNEEIQPAREHRFGGDGQCLGQCKKFMSGEEFRILGHIPSDNLRLVKMAELGRNSLENIE